MKNFQFIFLPLSIYLIAGILTGFAIELDQSVILIGGFIILCIFFYYKYRAGKQLFPDALAGFTTYLIIFYLGFTRSYFSRPEHQPGHYIHQNLEQTDSSLVSGRIIEEMKPATFSRKYLFEAGSIINHKNRVPVKGKILINIYRDSLNTLSLRPGTEIIIPFQPEIIKEPLNPFQFSYRNYLKHLQVERQSNLNHSQILITGEEPDVRSSAWRLRERLISKLKVLDFGQDELAVFQALILGQRRDISEQLYKDYAAAGAIHILAISGLHIGILLLLLNFLFKPIASLKYGKIIKPVLIILILWAFAYLTGLSPSVVRAVCMFSFLAIGMQLKRKTSSLNSLFLSLFFLLLINPYYLFQVGFQLSYLAVFSIIIFQPVLYKILTVKYRILDYFWKLISVSLAAQIGVIPLSIFYFHQFPGLFLITNLVVLPFLGVLLIFGIGVILLANLDLLPKFIEVTFSFMLKSLNNFVSEIAHFESFVFTDLKLNSFQTILLYTFIVSLIYLFRKTNFYSLSYALICILLFQGASIYSKGKTPVNESVVFHKSKGTVLGIKHNKQLDIYSNTNAVHPILADYIRERNIDTINLRELADIMNFSGKLTLIVDTTGNYNLKNFDPELLILRNSPKINLERLLQDLSPEKILVDGSNYDSYVQRWKGSARKAKIPFYHTGEKGAIINP